MGCEPERLYEFAVLTNIQYLILEGMNNEISLTKVLEWKRVKIPQEKNVYYWYIEYSAFVTAIAALLVVYVNTLLSQ